MMTPTECDGFATIPHISIAKFRHGTPEERAAEVARVRGAFENQGMALLLDHEIPKEIVSGCVEQAREFFALPRARKDQFPVPEGNTVRSYSCVTSPKGWLYNVQQEDEGRIINEWLLVRDSATDCNEENYYSCPEGKEFYSPLAKYPEQGNYPEEVPGLAAATSKYYRHVEQLANTMYEVFALAQGLDEKFFLAQAGHAPIWPVTIAHYPPQEKVPPEGTMRIQPHWDRTLFALVTTKDIEEQSKGGGLQILVDRETGCAADGRSMDSAVWRNVPIVPDSFVLNVGEMMARWTNGRFRHVVHRVPNPTEKSDKGRVSVMAYVLPDYNAPVECLPNCRVEGEEAKYESTWVGEMMNWGSQLPIYNQGKQERMRTAQGLYAQDGKQTTLGTPTDVNEVKEVSVQ